MKPIKPVRVPAPPGTLVQKAKAQLQQVRTVLAKADESEIQRRTEICNACPHLIRARIPQANRCGKCGCPIIGKTKFQRAKCPDNPPRW